MAIGNLRDKVSASDLDMVKNKRNPPEYEEGFGVGGEDEVGDDLGFDDISFDDAGGNFDFGGGGSGGIDTGDWGGSGGGDNWGGSGGGDNWEGMNNLIPGTGNIPGGVGQGTSQPEIKPTAIDKALDVVSEKAEEGLSATGRLFSEAISGVKKRTADDLAYLGRNYILAGGIALAVGIVCGIIGSIFSVPTLGFHRIGLHGIFCGGSTVAAGMAMMGCAVARIAKNDGVNDMDVSQLPDLGDIEKEDSTNEYEDNLDEVLSSLLGDDEEEDNLGFDDEEHEEDEDSFVPHSFLDDEEEIEEEKEEVVEQRDPREIIESISSNQYISRETLVNTFKQILATNTPGFSDRTELDPDSEEFQQIEALCLSAFASLLKVDDFEEINTEIERIVDTYFCYEIKMRRVKGLTKTEDIARELENFFRESSTDFTVVAKVDIEGNFYKIILTKGVDAVVTFGDCLQLDEVYKYFIDKKRLLPLIAGIDEYGKPMLVDGKNFPQTIIAGKPRSGKSWYVLSLLMPLMLFNTPEQVQLCIIDPKESTLFKTMSLMPHVCGLHDGSNIIQIMTDIIEREGARRKKLLADNRCEDIWALWEKGIQVPILYLVIDEVMTIKGNLGADFKEFLRLLMVILSQLPSQGIFLMMVPHRSQGIIDKTNRTMIGYACAIRADSEVVKETLDLKAWDRPLIKQGDMAIKMVGEGEAKFAKGVAMDTSDNKNTELLINAARVFYKMGVDIPDMSNIGSGFNRDEDYIREELATEGKRVQFDFD